MVNLQKSIIIEYDMRLGDIIRILPIAKHYADQGHRVFIKCNKEYEQILEAVTYAEPISEAIMDTELVDKFDLRIWPQRYQAFRESKMKWMDFVYKDFPEADRTIIFDNAQDELPDIYNLPPEYAVCFPIGASQIFRWDIELVCKMAYQWTMNEKLPVFYVVPGWTDKTNTLNTVWCQKLTHLIPLIKNAKEMLTINTSASIIAGAVREAPYYHLAEPSHNFQDDHDNEKQIKIIPK
jgi:hypothetical protein